MLFLYFVVVLVLSQRLSSATATFQASFRLLGYAYALFCVGVVGSTVSSATVTVQASFVFLGYALFYFTLLLVVVVKDARRSRFSVP